MRRTVLVAYCLLLTMMALAQPQAVSVAKHINTANGLSNDFVISLAIDGQGRVWVATEAGVNKIAGDMCQTLTDEQLAGTITALHWHRASGNMLIGTERGLTIYNEKSGSIHHLNGDDGLVMSSINDIADAADNGVWLVYGNGQVQHFDCTTFATKNLKLPQPHGSRCAMDDGHGHLYIGHSQHGMTVVNMRNGTSQNYQQTDDAHSLPGNNVRCIYQDHDGYIWVGTDTGLALFLPKTGTFTKVTDTADNYDDNIYDVLQMADGKLWVATDIGGVKTIGQDGAWHYDGTVAGLSSLNTRSIAEDEYGNIWVGNHSTGVDFISGSKRDFSLLGFKDAGGRYPSVGSIAADPEQGFWMASENELVWWHDGDIKGRWNYLNRIRREYAFPRCLMADHHGGVWLGIDDQGVYRFDKKSKQFAYIPIIPEGSDIHSFSEAADGHVWIGGEFGVYLYQNGKATLQEYVSKTVRAPATCIIETAPHQLFVATLGSGIYSINTLNNSCRHLSTNEGLPSSKVNHTIRTRQGELWMATNGGLVHVKDPVGLKGISVFGKEQGLNDCHILALQQDDNDCIWMTTYSGISCFVKSTGKFYNYNHQDTRLSGGFAIGAATTDAGGNIYFGSASGVCYFNPRQIGSGEQLSEVQLITCEAYNPVGNNTDIQVLTPDKAGRVFTTYRQNTIRLTFAMRNFAQTAAVDYSYMMKGMDSKWYDIGNDHDVVFRGLRPGQYTFILRAKLRSQDWEQAKQTQLTIIISPPFWKTWWAYLLYILLALGAMAYLVGQYKRKLTQRNTLELERREILQK